DRLLLYKGDVVTSELNRHGKDKGYGEINARISKDITDLLDRNSTRIIGASTHDETRLHDNYNLIKAYIDGYQWIVGQDDNALYLRRTDVALLGTIYSGPTQVYDSTSRKFEEVNAEIFKGRGYEVLLTNVTRHKGVDIRLTMMLPYLDPI